jgi:hypothetical protein
MDEGALQMMCLSLSEEALWAGLRGAPSLGTLEDILRRSPDVGISLCGGTFIPEGNPVSGRGGSYSR